MTYHIGMRLGNYSQCLVALELYSLLSLLNKKMDVIVKLRFMRVIYYNYNIFWEMRLNG